MKYFKGSMFVTLLGLTIGYILAGMEGVFIVGILGVLEVSLSFDNAVVNAKVLTTMEEVWRKRFITWGMLIAVFGMRMVFPILIVCVISGISPTNALQMAWSNPDEYERILTSSHDVIMGFGGTFLMMVFLKFFIDSEKDVHWIKIVESPLARLGELRLIHTLITVMGIGFTTLFLESENVTQFLIASLSGWAVYMIVDSLEMFVDTEDDDGDGESFSTETVNGAVVVKQVMRTGITAFVYLEILDASFSFDGVIGAFALSNNLFVIATGLGIGAMFVRSLTLMLVDKGALEQFKYLEHGAFWSIGSLAAIMYMNTILEIPEVVTGGLAALLIGISLAHSVYENRQGLQEALD